MRAFTFSRTRVFRSIPCFSGIVKRQFDFPEFFSSLLPPSPPRERRILEQRMGRSLAPLSRSISHAYSYLISHFLTGVFSQRAARTSKGGITRRRNYLPIFDVLNFVGERKIYPGINLKIEFFNFK